MKPFRTSAVALSLLAWAALAGAAGAAPSSGGEDGAVYAFARAATSDGGERVWYVLGGRAPLGDSTGDEIPDDWDPNADDGGVDGEGYDWVDDGYDLPDSIPADDFSRMRILQGAGLVGGGTYASALRQLELPFMFAGREQWVRNLSGQGVEDEQRLWDVAMESIRHEWNAERLLLGRTIAVGEERSPQAAFDDLGYWETLVPDWASAVRDDLAAEGIPFSVELLSSPQINLTDPSKPLFGKGEMPGSLFQLGVLQEGENDYLRSVSAEELMREVWPSYWRYYHRPAGSPVPDDLRAGLTFGSPVLQADGTYLRSPVMSTNSYMRWLAYGYPGYNVDEDVDGLMGYDPGGFGPNFYFVGSFERFAPWNLDDATIARYETLLAGK